MAPVGRRTSLGRGAKERILVAALELFTRQGFNATGVNDLHRAARVSKRTLYQHFESKDELILAYLAEYGRGGPIEALLSREDLAPRTRLLELFTTLADPHSVVPDPILAATVEFPDREHRVHQAAVRQSRQFNDRITALARAAGARDPELTARRVVTVYEGACSRLLVEDAAAVVTGAYQMATVILRDAID